MNFRAVLVSLLALVLADAVANERIAALGLDRLGALAGGTGGRLAVFFVVLAVLLSGLASVVAIARAARRAQELARAREGATLARGMLRGGALSGGLD